VPDNTCLLVNSQPDAVGRLTSIRQTTSLSRLTSSRFSSAIAFKSDKLDLIAGQLELMEPDAGRPAREKDAKLNVAVFAPQLPALGQSRHLRRPPDTSAQPQRPDMKVGPPIPTALGRAIVRGCLKNQA